MSAFRLLVVEDSDDDLRICRDSVIAYKDEKERTIEMVECKSVKETFGKLDNSFDGAIIDLKLAGPGDEGNQVIKRIDEFHFRIPVAVLTGTPDHADRNLAYIGIFKKGETRYAELFDKFWDIHNTGLTRIMGGRGKIEETLNKVFLENLLPQKDKWVAYGKVNSDKTEKALLRYALNHLLQLLDDDGEDYFPEEVYLAPPLTNEIRTGSIVKKKVGDLPFAVFNPACDLVVRGNGVFKTDRILLVEIEKTQDVVNSSLHGISKDDKKKIKLRSVLSNNYTVYYHWLPKTDFFVGGFLNFRKIISLNKNKFEEDFEVPPKIQISPSFVKDVIARFSSFYARQGQPDIECEGFITELTTQPGDSQ